MIETAWPLLLVTGLLGLALGILGGFLAARLIARRGGDRERAEALRLELDEYREEVNAHFARTSELFTELTERYRDVYEHLAGGAQSLCRPGESGPALEIVARKLLTTGPGASEAQEADRRAGEGGNGAAAQPKGGKASRPARPG